MISYTNEKRNALKSPKNGYCGQKGIRAAFHNVSRILGLTYPRYIKYVFDGKDTKKNGHVSQRSRFVKPNTVTMSKQCKYNKKNRHISQRGGFGVIKAMSNSDFCKDKKKPGFTPVKSLDVFLYDCIKGGQCTIYASGYREKPTQGKKK
jgi:hypothetical protein